MMIEIDQSVYFPATMFIIMLLLGAVSVYLIIKLRRKCAEKIPSNLLMIDVLALLLLIISTIQDLIKYPDRLFENDWWYVYASMYLGTTMIVIAGFYAVSLVGIIGVNRMVDKFKRKEDLS